MGQAVQLAAEPRDPAGTPLPGRAVTWSSSDANIATVDQAGVVSGVAPGAVTITATSEGVEGTASILVVALDMERPSAGGDQSTLKIRRACDGAQAASGYHRDPRLIVASRPSGPGSFLAPSFLR